MRVCGWEKRLDAVIGAVLVRPYVLGENDCLRLACAVVSTLTGTDHWPTFSGYRTKRQALVKIARVAPSLGDAVSVTLATAPSSMRSAQRGDLALFRDDAGEDHLGICIGRDVVLMAAEGVLTVPIDDARLLCSWRIG